MVALAIPRRGCEDRRRSSFSSTVTTGGRVLPALPRLGRLGASVVGCVAAVGKARCLRWRQRRRLPVWSGRGPVRLRGLARVAGKILQTKRRSISVGQNQGKYDDNGKQVLFLHLLLSNQIVLRGGRGHVRPDSRGDSAKFAAALKKRRSILHGRGWLPAYNWSRKARSGSRRRRCGEMSFGRFGCQTQGWRRAGSWRGGQ